MERGIRNAQVHTQFLGKMYASMQKGVSNRETKNAKGNGNN